MSYSKTEVKKIKDAYAKLQKEAATFQQAILKFSFSYTTYCEGLDEWHESIDNKLYELECDIRDNTEYSWATK